LAFRKKLLRGRVRGSFEPASSGEWCGNAVGNATREEAEANGHDPVMRWFAVRKTRVVETGDPVNYRYVDCRLGNLVPEEATPEN
jgi:hypothetical protein